MGIGAQLLDPGLVLRPGPIPGRREHGPHPIEAFGLGHLPRPAFQRFEAGHKRVWPATKRLNEPGAAGIPIENEKKRSHGGQW